MDAPDSAVAARLGTLGWYFALADRVSEGRRFLDLARSVTLDDAPVELRIEQLANLCYLAAEEFDLPAALAAGEDALSLAATAAAPWQLGFAQLMLALALAQSGDDGTRPTRWRTTRPPRSKRPETTGASQPAASSVQSVRPTPATSPPSPRGRRQPTVTRTRSTTTRFAFRRCCSRPGSRSGRQDRAAAEDANRRALELAGRIGFGDHAAFALAALGSSALAHGDLREAEELLRQALATAEAAEAPWVAAHARVQLGRVAAAAGDAEGAERLYRHVLEWSQMPRPHHGRESLFVALAGSPADAAQCSG